MPFAFAFFPEGGQGEQPSSPPHAPRTHDLLCGVVPSLRPRALPDAARRWTVVLGTTSVSAVNGSALSEQDPLARKSDVTPGVYEGGFKLWEGTQDLINVVMQLNLDASRPLRVLDLGCGSGLCGLFMLLNFPNVHVTFQDLNESVLVKAVLPNVCLNAKHEEDLFRTRFVFGPWEASASRLFGPLEKYDLILTAETTYHVESFEALHGVLSDSLAPQGKVVVASKRFYFGVGGGSLSFIDQVVKPHAVFDSEVVYTVADGVSNLRDVFTLTRRNG